MLFDIYHHIFPEKILTTYIPSVLHRHKTNIAKFSCYIGIPY